MISQTKRRFQPVRGDVIAALVGIAPLLLLDAWTGMVAGVPTADRKSTRLNSSHYS